MAYDIYTRHDSQLAVHSSGLATKSKMLCDITLKNSGPVIIGGLGLLLRGTITQFLEETASNQ